MAEKETNKKDVDILAGKSDEEIRRAATFWFMGQDCFLRGENVPASVFALSTEGLTESDIEWAHRMAAANGWINEQRTEN